MRDRSMLRALTLTPVASCALGLVHTFGVYAEGRGVKVRALVAGGPLRAAGVEEGDTILSVDGANVNRPHEISNAITPEPPSPNKAYPWPDRTPAWPWD